MSAWPISSAMLPGFTDPPYWMRTPSAAAAPAVSPTTERTVAHMAWASSDVAVRPVPIAQIGSYAITIDATASAATPSKPARTWVATLVSASPASRSSSVSPQHRIGVMPAASTAFTLALTTSSVSPKS